MSPATAVMNLNLFLDGLILRDLIIQNIFERAEAPGVAKEAGVGERRVHTLSKSSLARACHRRQRCQSQSVWRPIAGGHQLCTIMLTRVNPPRSIPTSG